MEQGKTLAHAEGETVYLEDCRWSSTPDMDTYTDCLLSGVCAGITLFNFFAMIPLWMFHIGMVCSNTYLLKPSEQVPSCTKRLAKILQIQPDCQQPVVNFICDHPAIKVISFVGSTKRMENTSMPEMWTYLTTENFCRELTYCIASSLCT
uniref:Aldehyde dehydrogenase domain-containing protein n=1 Tax=Monopterus albus TaxID=43700 RepID=A0A3Q3K465_MONAL